MEHVERRHPEMTDEGERILETLSSPDYVQEGDSGTLIAVKHYPKTPLGVIERYAIGGAMGATFYVEPLLTFDLEVFVILRQNTSGLLSLAPLYEALRARGYVEEGECVLVEDIPVQFLPAYNALLEEALREARQTLYEEVSTRVVRAEHLIAICLQTARDKDRERVRIFREQAELDRDYLTGVLQRHGLEGQWKQWTP